MVTTIVVKGEMTMADSDTPDLEEYYDISVKLTDDVADHPDRVQRYLDELADKINAADHVHIQQDTSSGIRRDASGSWQDATLAIQPYLGCGSKKPEDGDGDGDGGDEQG